MRWAYDGEVDNLYVYVRPGAARRQVHLSDRVIVDVDDDGSIVGVEILSLTAGWDAEAIAERFDLSEDERNGLVHMAARVSPVRTSTVRIERLRGFSSAFPVIEDVAAAGPSPTVHNERNAELLIA